MADNRDKELLMPDETKVTSARLPRARVRTPGFLSQPLPFGRCVHLARGKGFAAVTLLRKTAAYPDIPQYRSRGVLLRWETTRG